MLLKLVANRRRRKGVDAESVDERAREVQINVNFQTTFQASKIRELHFDFQRLEGLTVGSAFVSLTNCDTLKSEGTGCHSDPATLEPFAFSTIHRANTVCTEWFSLHFIEFHYWEEIRPKFVSNANLACALIQKLLKCSNLEPPETINSVGWNHFNEMASLLLEPPSARFGVEALFIVKNYCQKLLAVCNADSLSDIQWTLFALSNYS